MSHGDEIFPEFIGDTRGPVEKFQSCRSGNAGVIGENSNLNLDGEGIAENSTGSEGNAKGSDVNFESPDDAGVVIIPTYTWILMQHLLDL